MTGVALVAAGFGVALVPESATAIAVPNVVYKPLVDLPESAKVDLSCIYMREDTSPILARFLTAIREFAGIAAPTGG